MCIYKLLHHLHLLGSFCQSLVKVQINYRGTSDSTRRNSSSIRRITLRSNRSSRGGRWSRSGVGHHERSDNSAQNTKCNNTKQSILITLHHFLHWCPHCHIHSVFGNQGDDDESKRGTQLHTGRVQGSNDALVFVLGIFECCDLCREDRGAEADDVNQ